MSQLRNYSAPKFRAPTIRHNIAYSVFEYEAGVKETEAVCRLVEEKLEQYVTPAKIIVYGGTIVQTRELSRALGCHEYYREVGDREEKEEIMGRWQRGDGRVIVATNASGLGIGEPNVRAVIHAGNIYHIEHYSQEGGRGGRDGNRSEAVVIIPAGKQESLQKKQAQARRQPWKIKSWVTSEAEERQVEWDKVERFLSGEKCRRIYLDQEMDGRVDRERCEEGEEQCDCCEFQVRGGNIWITK
jgi:superfamily II DNA helicase RecQ